MNSSLSVLQKVDYLDINTPISTNNRYLAGSNQMPTFRGRCIPHAGLILSRCEHFAVAGDAASSNRVGSSEWRAAGEAWAGNRSNKAELLSR